MGNQKYAIIVSKLWISNPKNLIVLLTENFNFPFHCQTGNVFKGVMLPGMTFTIEPILTLGEPKFKILGDEWTATTKDNSRTAQFEHTVLITSNGCEILTHPDSHEEQRSDEMK